MLRSFSTIVLFVVSSASAVVAEQIDYEKQIKPVLAERCYACHGVLKQEGGLRLDTAALAIKGGDSGEAITRGDPEASLLIQRVTSTDQSERMPGEGQPLKPEQIAVLRTWIAQQAPAPADEQPEQDPRDHWAFRPIVRPPVPQVGNTSWVRNPIDAFIAQRHEQRGLTPKAEAPREVLIRRLFIDMIGLPASQEELAGLNADHSEAWYERLVERLLADPRHGERWARHWMDIWRYSDWWGLNGQVRYSQRHIWRWRDWIVESLNSNVPYDEMIRSMLAADELYPNDLKKLAATGFLVRNYYIYGRNPWMEETVEHVGKGLLGLTFNCAKCHDHKYDPIEQADYYRLRAFFEPYHVRVDVVPGQSDLAYDGVPRVFDGHLDRPTYLFERGQEAQPDKSTVIAPGVPKMLAQEGFAVHPVSLPVEAWQPERRPWVLEAYLTNSRDKVAGAEAALAPIMEKLKAARREYKELKKTSGAVQPATGSAEENSPKAEAVQDAGVEAKLAAAGAAITEVKAELHVATLAVQAANAELTSVKTRVKAMRAEWAQDEAATEDQSKSTEGVRSAIEQAVQAERWAVVAKAAHAVAEVELRLLRAPTEGKAAIEMELNASRESLSKAEQRAASEVVETDRYVRLPGAISAPTHHILVQQPDPEVKFTAQSTGRRTALAAWITDNRNPLAARVAVNHIWARHFGTPIVASVFDFGRKGTPPTHPELLDWLAAELIESGWDMKGLHRLIVESSTYRMSSSAADSDANLAKDPDNRDLWRRLPVRLESQVLRDAILTLTGTIDLTLGGPPVDAAAQAASVRRSLYFVHASDDRNMFLTTFDDASVNECYRRDQSIIPQQALALSNSAFVHDASRQIVQRLLQSDRETDGSLDDVEFIKKAYYVILNAQASEDEIKASVKAMEAWRKLPEAKADESVDLARQYLVWALLNHTDFVTVR